MLCLLEWSADSTFLWLSLRNRVFVAVSWKITQPRVKLGWKKGVCRAICGAPRWWRKYNCAVVARLAFSPRSLPHLLLCYLGNMQRGLSLLKSWSLCVSQRWHCHPHRCAEAQDTKVTVIPQSATLVLSGSTTSEREAVGQRESKSLEAASSPHRPSETQLLIWLRDACLPQINTGHDVLKFLPLSCLHLGLERWDLTISEISRRARESEMKETWGVSLTPLGKFWSAPTCTRARSSPFPPIIHMITCLSKSPV